MPDQRVQLRAQILQQHVAAVEHAVAALPAERQDQFVERQKRNRRRLGLHPARQVGERVLAAPRVVVEFDEQAALAVVDDLRVLARRVVDGFVEIRAEQVRRVADLLPFAAGGGEPLAVEPHLEAELRADRGLIERAGREVALQLQHRGQRVRHERVVPARLLQACFHDRGLLALRAVDDGRCHPRVGGRGRAARHRELQHRGVAGRAVGLGKRVGGRRREARRARGRAARRHRVRRAGGRYGGARHRRARQRRQRRHARHEIRIRRRAIEHVGCHRYAAQRGGEVS